MNQKDPHSASQSTAGSHRAQPFRYHIDRERAIVFLEYGSAAPAFEEWRAAMEALLSDPAYRPGMAFVSDRRRLKGSPTTETIQRMAAYESEHRDRFGSCRFAVVTDPASLADFGMARMSQALLEVSRSGIVLRPFVDMELAIEWATTRVDGE